MADTKHTFRIIDSSKKAGPPIWKALLVIIVGPGALMWPGALMDNGAMQWAGFLMFILFLALLLSRWASEFVTPDEARKKISEIEESQT